MEDKNLQKGWCIALLGDLLDYEQPTKYIVENTDYSDKYETPVLTAGKSFLLGYTNETAGIFNNLPVIIFDDFTTAIKFVDFPFKVKSSAMKILVPSDIEVNIKYVHYFMQTLRLNVDTHKRYWISVGSLKSIPFAPAAEQQRITAKIEELFSELDNAVETLNKAKQQLKIYRQSVLKYAFEGKLTNPDVKDGELPEGWDVRTIADVTESLSQGWSPKCDNKSSANESEWAVITTTAIQHIKFSDIENKVLPKHLEPRTQHELVDGDVLITRAGPRNRVGVCCLVKEPRKRLLNCDKAYRIKVKRDRVLPSYLVQVLNTSEFLSLIDKCKSGGNDSGLNLTQTVFSSMRIHIPRKLSEQEIILGEIESRLSVCDNIEVSIEQGLQQAEALRQSILKKAFEGKLVPQDARDENASILLERIKAERAESQPQKKIKAKKNK